MFSRFRVWLAGLLLPKGYRVSEVVSRRSVDLVRQRKSLDLQAKEIGELWKNVIEENEKNGRRRNEHAPTRLAFRVDPNELRVADDESAQVLAEMRTGIQASKARIAERREARFRSDSTESQDENA